MKYMIHMVPKREWYVRDFLIPSMIKQGIRKGDIVIWNDDKGYGNLTSFVKSVEYVNENLKAEIGMWHLQDDIVIAEDFKKTADGLSNADLIVCGFYEKTYLKLKKALPNVQCNMNGASNSFQCIWIPNTVLDGFPLWVNEKTNGAYKANTLETCDDKTFRGNKNDDLIFRKYILDKYPNFKTLTLLKPMVQHVDYLIGGSSIYNRKSKYVTVNFNQEIVKNLEKAIKRYKEKWQDQESK